MEKMQFVCPKCGCHEFVQDQFQATGGTMAKLFDIQNKKFITISCEKCRIYRNLSGGNIHRCKYSGLPHWKLKTV